MSNFYLTTPDGISWLANDRGDIYLYQRMEEGYCKETLFENEFLERYSESEVQGVETIKLKDVK